MYLSSSLFEKYSQICSSSASWEVDCKVVDDSEGKSFKQILSDFMRNIFNSFRNIFKISRNIFKLLRNILTQICSSSASWEVACKVVDDSEGESRAAKQKPETVP